MADNQPKRTLIYETVIEHIKAQLINGELKPGARLLTVAALAEQLEVGQASVREAYRILESIGILEVTQGWGTFDDMSWEQGAMVEPLAVAMHAVNLTPIKLMDNLVIVGAGTIGLFTLLAARLKGAGKIIITDLSPHRLAIARQLGADVTVNVAE